MTGYELYKKVCSVMGIYNFEEGNLPLKAEAMTDIINQICSDLKISGIKILSDKINLSQNLSEALIYGCAMLLSVAVKDSGCSDFYSRIYNAKRTAVLSDSDRRYDVIPAAYGGN